MSQITEQEVLKLGKLSKLDYSDEQKKAAMQNNLNDILDFISQLSQVETEGLEPMTGTIKDATAREREDEVTDNNEGDDVLVAPLAPESEMNFFVVPRVVE